MNRRAFLAALGLSPLLARAASAPAVFVVHPYDTPSRLYARFRPLTLYLGGVLGRPMRLVITASPQVSATDVAAVRLALLHPDAVGQDAFLSLGQHVSFTPIDDAHFHAVRRMEQALRKW